MKFSEAIRALRHQLGLTQPRFAKKLGLSVPSIAHYEIGKRKPDAESTARLCRAAVEAKRLDLADVFAAAIPGVADGLLVPQWRIPAPPPTALGLDPNRHATFETPPPAQRQPRYVTVLVSKKEPD